MAGFLCLQVVRGHLDIRYHSVGHVICILRDDQFPGTKSGNGKPRQVTSYGVTRRHPPTRSAHSFLTIRVTPSASLNTMTTSSTAKPSRRPFNAARLLAEHLTPPP